MYVYTKIIFSNSHYYVNTIFGGLGCPINTPKAYYISLLLAQARRLLDCLAMILQVASGTRDPTLSWSWILDRKLSSSDLHRSWVFFDFTYFFLGRQFESLAPSVWFGLNFNKIDGGNNDFESSQEMLHSIRKFKVLANMIFHESHVSFKQCPGMN